MHYARDAAESHPAVRCPLMLLSSSNRRLDRIFLLGLLFVRLAQIHNSARARRRFLLRPPSGEVRNEKHVRLAGLSVTKNLFDPYVAVSRGTRDGAAGLVHFSARLGAGIGHQPRVVPFPLSQVELGRALHVHSFFRPLHGYAGDRLDGYMFLGAERGVVVVVFACCLSHTVVWCVYVEGPVQILLLLGLPGGFNS